MIQLQQYYLDYIQYLFLVFYSIISLNILYFLAKFCVVWLADGFSIRRNKTNIKFIIEFFTPGVISIKISYAFWQVIQLLPLEILSVLSIIFIILVLAWWYDYPLNIEVIAWELKHFVPLAYWLLKLILFVLMVLLSIIFIIFIIAMIKERIL